MFFDKSMSPMPRLWTVRFSKSGSQLIELLYRFWSAKLNFMRTRDILLRYLILSCSMASRLKNRKQDEMIGPLSSLV